MSTTLAATALLMGLAGGPHCVAMCGAACAGITRGGAGAAAGAAGDSGGVAVIDVLGVGRRGSVSLSAWNFQFGRLAGYSAAGAVAATAVESLAWLSAQTAASRPLWSLFHLAVLAWALMLVTRAQQPAWVSAAGRAAWQRIRPLAATRGGVVGAGALWAFMPCGLLYSALLVASLAGDALQGALSMALFAVGSSIWLLAAPRLLTLVRGGGNRLRQDWGTRAAGALLALSALWALWHDLAHRIAVWCGLA